MRYPILLLFTTLFFQGFAQNPTAPYQGKFEQLGHLITPPGPYRTASGAPGKEYWQQRADYLIKASIDESTNTLRGEETVTYYNNSPDALPYLWLQLEQNINKKGNEDFGDSFGGIGDSVTTLQMQYLVRPLDFDAGCQIKSVKDKSGNPIDFIVNNTMMKVNLNEALQPGQSVRLDINWSYAITDRSMFLLSREGYEHFPEDGNNVYLIAHWYPRMAVYNDTEGWQNKQFQRLGEFALEFGNFDVEITVPEDHIVAATGTLLNSSEMLGKKQLKRLQEARQSFDKPVMIVTPEEAKANEKEKSTATRTWKFRAENVRDFALASSRKFIWDAQAVNLSGKTVMAMSFYPNEGLPVWSEESTKAVANALEVYSEATFDYPYPVAISVNTSNIGMEFPMISFNGGRPVHGFISEGAKAGMIGTIVHEVGHNWFPMIVSSDERQWMWMDEGLNTFLHQRTMALRYPQFHHTVPADIVTYMTGTKDIMRPVMVQSDNENMFAFGANFYQKPTVALQILRNTVIGRELFDPAFKEYANRWKYKHPNPADLFRTLEEATAVDLDWFWRGWFFTTDHVDIELATVKWLVVKENKEQETALAGTGGMAMNPDITNFAGGPLEVTMIPTPDQYYGQFLSRLDDKAMRKAVEGKNLYELTFKNLGGLVMPIIVEWTYADGTTEIDRLPVEVWRHNEAEVVKTFLKDKEVISINLDPNKELADVNTENNAFPRVKEVSRFEQFKAGDK